MTEVITIEYTEGYEFPIYIKATEPDGPHCDMYLTIGEAKLLHEKLGKELNRLAALDPERNK